MATASKTARLADSNEREAGSLEHWDVFMGDINPNPAFEKSRFVREGRRTVVV
jgi:hypothetical protein